MQKLFGRCNGDFFILHGGAGYIDPKGADLIAATKVLIAIAEKHGATVQSPLDIVTGCLKAMEDDPSFNAGLGGCLQNDGIVRVTAALMDSDSGKFSGVVNATNLRHPTEMAKALQDYSHSRVLTSPGTETMARKLGLEVSDNLTAKRFAQWEKLRRAGLENVEGHDTVGAVCLQGLRLVAGTSTGGLLNVVPGRMSDSATVAGNYASRFSAISVTGTGEQIVDDAVAARIDTRVRDGMSLEAASEKTFAEATERHHGYGWIALSANKEWSVCFTTEGMPFVVYEIGKGVVASSI